MPADNYHHVGSKSIGFMSLIFAARGANPLYSQETRLLEEKVASRKGMRERLLNPDQLTLKPAL